MMNKKLFSSLLIGGLLFSFTGGFVSCSEDYDDDIKGLQAQIDAQRASLAEIETLLQSGVVIKDVKSDTNGIKLILSNGNEYVLTHGKDGKDGKDAAVWTIGTDGYWYLNNEKTEYKAIGIDGVDGKDGADGKDGKDGVDGDTIYYAPENGVWVKYVNGVKDETYEGESIYVEGVVTAVWDSENGSLTLYNVEGTEEPLVLNWSIIADLASRVQSMVNVPINKYGNPAMEFAWDLTHDWGMPGTTTALPYELR